MIRIDMSLKKILKKSIKVYIFFGMRPLLIWWQNKNKN